MTIADLLEVKTAATWHWVVQHIFPIFFHLFILIRHIVRKKNHIKIFCTEILAEMIFGWSTFKVMCDTPIFY